MNFWKRKLAAYLHDPPEKAYDFGPGHKQRAEVHSQNFDVHELWRAMGGNPDWSAAAADRFVFPHGTKVGALGEDGQVAFVHPISGRSDDGRPALPSGNIDFPSSDDARSWLGDISPAWKSSDPESLFLLAWRQWSEVAARIHIGKGKGAEVLPYLPADTRCPDGTIWHHCAVVSALEACRSGPEFGQPVAPAFLLFQVGPVQEFIAQARSTRDLWSGSYLLSWLMMHAIRAVTDECGPDAIIFPSLRGQPLFDFLLEQRLRDKVPDEHALVPGIPNRFLAVVPSSFDATIAQKAFHEEWRHIADTCRGWLIDVTQGKIPFAEPFGKLFDEQVDRHWHITWELLPWDSCEGALRAFAGLPLGANNPLHLAKIVAESIPEAHKDGRCYRDGRLDPGWAWSAHYQSCQHALDARRALRDFHGLKPDLHRKPGERDAFSGRDEAILQSDALQRLTSPELRVLFRHADALGAANLIKRIWHKAYLARLDALAEPEEKKLHPRSLRRASEAFDSVLSVAAGAWRRRLGQRLETDAALWERVVSLSEALHDCREILRSVSIPERVGSGSKATEKSWLARVDAEVFSCLFWASLPEEVRADEFVCRAGEQLARLKKTHRISEPPAYYAVLALDGDQIGRWLSGEKSPAVDRILSPKAGDYFEKRMLSAMTAGERERFELALVKLASKGNAPDKPKGWQGDWPPCGAADWIRAWLACPRPLGPSWHLQFSEALANFSIHAARRIVEEVHCGQLIYSGGDDVLAMLPADEAIGCATDLRAAFQGRFVDMSTDCQRLFRDEAPEGFLWLKDPRGNDPSWPLLVPGPRMTVSVGIAIAHVKEPLQDVVQEAQRAEKRAKAQPEKLIFDRAGDDQGGQIRKWVSNEGWDRNAVAVTLFKRSGEMIHWGARFESAAFRLLETLRRHYRKPWDKPNAPTAVTGRFPHRMAELLEPYGGTTPVSVLKEVFLREVQFVINRQTLPDEEAAKLVSETSGGPFRRQDLQQQCAHYLDELAAFSWNRPGEDAPTICSRTVGEFVNLFLLEAFIRRQSD